MAAQEQKASSTASGTALKSVLHAAADLQPAVTINSGIELYKVLSTPLTHDLAVIFQGKRHTIHSV